MRGDRARNEPGLFFVSTSLYSRLVWSWRAENAAHAGFPRSKAQISLQRRLSGGCPSPMQGALLYNDDWHVLVDSAVDQPSLLISPSLESHTIYLSCDSKEACSKQRLKCGIKLTLG
jgi:hypothetical protein